MARPCQHKEHVQGCHICFLVSTREDYRILWGEPDPKCIYLGDYTGERVKCPTCRGNVELFVFSCLLHGKCTQGKKVNGIASCEHCKDKCTTRVTPRVNSVVVPQPPDLQLAPKSTRALVTVAAGKEWKELLEISRPFMEAYAKRLGADFVVLDWPGHPDWPMSSKYAIGRVLDYYDRIAYLDADVLPRPGCVDVFSLCPEDAFGACDELPFHKSQPQHGTLKKYLEFRKSLGFPDRNITWQFNCGVMVVPKRYQELLLPPNYPLPINHLSEQFHTNSRVLDSGAKFFNLPRESNYQWWTDPHYKKSPPDAILHFSGCSPYAHRLAEMKRWASYHLDKSPLLPPGAFAAIFVPLQGQVVKYVPMPGGNVGDKLLELATFQLLDYFRIKQSKAGEDYDHILIAPGGNMGRVLNQEARKCREDTLTWGKPVTVLPQSFLGGEELPYHKIWVREQGSLRYCPLASLAPDLALGLDLTTLGLTPQEPSQEGLWLRQDGEGMFRDVPCLGDPALLCQSPLEYINLAATCSHVITDRLHFAIAGMLLGRKVTLLPNCYHKNRSLWETWLKDLKCEWKDCP